MTATRAIRTVFCLLFLLCAVAHPTSVNANYTGSDPSWHFTTDLSLNTNINVSVVSGDVLNGNGNNLQSGDTVCSGATIEVTPSYSTRWAVSNLNIASIYPSCGGGTYCPAMLPGPTLSNNKDISWIAASIFDSQKTFGDANDWSQNQNLYAQLGAFSTEPMSYDNGSANLIINKEGGATIVCKGSLDASYGSTVAATEAMPSNAPMSITINKSGTYAISTSLNGVSCFGAVVKHPDNTQTQKSWFYFYYFTHNPPTIGATTASSTVTINVAANGGTCTMHPTAISVSRSAAATGTTMVKTTMHSDADPIHVLSVTSSNTAFTAAPFPVNLGSILGFGSLSPTSNGFNTTINSGANQDLYVLVTTSAASGGTVLTFNAETISAACGSSSRCSAIADLSSPNAVTCNIAPPSLNLANKVTNGQVTSAELGQFNVGCQDLAGATVPCTGSNWAASPGLALTFEAADSTHAQVYSNAVPPTSGTVTYTSQGNPIPIAKCNANLNVVTPQDIINGGNTTLSCDFLPPAANMSFNEAKYFALNCLLNSTTAVSPTSASYDHINGLRGSTSNESLRGATYTAPGSSTNGDLQGIASYNVRPNVIGAVALAPITTGNTGTPVSCSIQPAYAELGPQEYGEFDVTCRDSVNNVVGCSGNAWTWSGIPGQFIASQTDNTHTWAYPDAGAQIGSFGALTYTTGTVSCNSTVKVVPSNFSCEFVPPSANVKVNGTKYFETHAYDLRSGTPVPMTPTGVIYDLIKGLGGSHSNDSVTGTLYQAPSDNNSGQLQGAAALNTGSFIKGVVCLADITVGNGNNNNNNSGPTNGKSQWCTILSSENLYPGYIGWVSLWCGSNANETCTIANWGNSQGVRVSPAGTSGAYINVTAATGVSGRIEAVVSSDGKESCILTFTSGSTNCADLS